MQLKFGGLGRSPQRGPGAEIFGFLRPPDAILAIRNIALMGVNKHTAM